MTLQVYTARISSRDPDRFDVTRKSGGEHGVIFAPSWGILRPALAARRRADKWRMSMFVGEATRIEDAMWARYVPAYVDEMRRSYAEHRDAWAALLARPRVVLVCYCTDYERCHRTLLGRDILPKLGAMYAGEIRP